MKPKLLLRIAAVLVLIHLLGHTIGHLGWDKPADPNMQQVVTAMKTNTAEFMGATKSIANYYNGYSLMMFGIFGMTILLLWIISGFITEQRSIAKKLLYPMGLAYLFFGVVEFIEFFPFAAAMSFLAGVLVLLAATIVQQKPSESHAARLPAGQRA